MRWRAFLGWGLSPLARGNPRRQSPKVCGKGPIPARTGQPQGQHPGKYCQWAYPRSHGATKPWERQSLLSRGLSPLARGNPACKPRHPPARGPIPARTGQPRRWWSVTRSSRAYPRSHGATVPGISRHTHNWGLSPLARGNPPYAHRYFPYVRPIPARTGQPLTKALFPPSKGAYPRSHGATVRMPQAGAFAAGLSPLARGNPTRVMLPRARTGPIPARTGQPGRGRPRGDLQKAYPRSHGATYCPGHLVLWEEGLSPLARGNPHWPATQCTPLGPIPARTGQPLLKKRVCLGYRAYPRSHGATWTRATTR